MSGHSGFSGGVDVFDSVVDEQDLVCLDTEQIEGRVVYFGMGLDVSDCGRIENVVEGAVDSQSA